MRLIDDNQLKKSYPRDSVAENIDGTVIGDRPFRSGTSFRPAGLPFDRPFAVLTTVRRSGDLSASPSMRYTSRVTDNRFSLVLI